MKKCLIRIFWTLLAITAMASLTSCGSALTRAAQKGDMAALEKLLDQGADVSERHGILGMTPLMEAAREGNSEVVVVLLEYGSSINAQATTGAVAKWTALSFAAAEGHVDTVKLLLEKGADIDWALIGLEREAAKFYSPNQIQAQVGIKIIERFSKNMGTATAQKAIAGIPEETSHTVTSDVDILPQVQVQPRKKAHAIVVGIEKYRQQLPKANYAERDARIVAEYLSRVMGYSESNIVRLLDDHATKSDMTKYLEKWLANNVEPGGTVFVYFSGHGAPNPRTGDAYLVPYDGDPTFIAETGYSLKRLYAVLGKLPAKEVIVALDSCFSGAGGRSVLAKGARPLVMNLQTETALSKNMTVLSASAGDQISSTYNEKGHGLFTYFLLKGIKNEDVLNPDGSLHMEDLYGYLKPRVERIARKQYNNEQTPQLTEAGKN